MHNPNPLDLAEWAEAIVALSTAVENLWLAGGTRADIATAIEVGIESAGPTADD